MKILFEFFLVLTCLSGSFVAGCVYKSWALKEVEAAYMSARQAYEKAVAELRASL